MTENRRILIADDEQTFCYSTGELLRKEGYQCDCVLDANQAIEKLKDGCYDLLIADIKMPGNPELQLIKELPKIARNIPVILITAYPSVKSAVEAIHLSVISYMVKPVDFQQLKKSVLESMKQKKLVQAISHAKQRLKESKKQITILEELLEKRNAQAFNSSIKSFTEFTLSNITASFLDLKNITSILTDDKNESAVCNLVNCPRLEMLSDGLANAIKTLELTKSAFKSKELGHLRIRLEHLIKKTKNV
ncbi:MAG: Transcriptional regulatory protein ZraR [Planctomycetes bacterium ADurb.Bin401]|nr:MAG: Transcriptional regulatory protein ZraR [Planctomycetes bacterium ADurb.Bin401]